MFLVILYIGAGIYLLLMAAGLVQRKFWDGVDPYTRPNVRLAMAIFGLGTLVLGLYTAGTYQLYRQQALPGQKNAVRESTQPVGQRPGAQDASAAEPARLPTGAE